MEVSIIDILGRVVYCSSFDKTSEINISKLSEGIYIAKIKSNGVIVGETKFIKRLQLKSNG